MLVSEFMIPAGKVLACNPDNTIKMALDIMIAKKVGSVVVLNPDDPNKPSGIVTKTDMVEAYQKGITLDHKLSDIMKTDLLTIQDSHTRDNAAKAFEATKNHHALVLNKDGKFVGIVSSWDITTECAKDDRAWPWNRSADGKFHKPNEKKVSPAPSSPRSVQRASDPRRESHTYLDYVDSLREGWEMDD